MAQDEVITDLKNQVAHLQQRLRARSFELDVLYELSFKISDSLSYEQLFRSILSHLGQAVSYDVAAGLLCTDRSQEMYLHQVRRLRPEVQAEMEQRLLCTCTRMGGLEAKAETVTRTIIEPQTDDASEPPVERLNSFFQVPIMAGGTTVGLIFVGSAAADHFGEDHVRLLYMVANQASAAVERLHSWAKSERKRLKTIVQHLPEGIILLDDANVVALANPVGRNWLKILGGISVGEPLTHLASHSFQELIEKTPLDLTIHSPGLRILQALVISLDARHRDTAWMLVLRDVTEAREEVSRRDRFMAMLAHELRNPLAPILHAINIIDSRQADEAGRRSAQTVLGRQVRHVVHLVDDLLDISRFLHGKVTLQREPVNLSELIHSAVDTHRSTIQDRQQQLTIQVDPSLWVRGDSTRLNQIISNLISNSIKYTPGTGRIEVECRQSDQTVLLQVRDTGLGISPETLASIFDPFVQMDETLARSEGGLGLGLALVRILVTMHGGTVMAYSEGMGEGSTFEVRLPLIPPQVARAPALSFHASAALRVLIVEDNMDAGDMLKSLLELEGHQVVIARNGLEGVEAFCRTTPHLALVDIGLPEMDGYQVARHIRRQPHGHSVYLAALTGYAQPKDRARSREAGFDAHLAKPIDVDQLDDLLRLVGRQTAPAKG